MSEADLSKPRPFTQHIPCPTCTGKGWKRQQNGYSLIPCPHCETKRVIPLIDPDGCWAKKTTLASHVELGL